MLTLMFPYVHIVYNIMLNITDIGWFEQVIECFFGFCFKKYVKWILNYPHMWLLYLCGYVRFVMDFGLTNLYDD